MILPSSLIKKALYYAAEKHDGQYRKGTKVPFIVHPVLVAFTISKYTYNEDIIVAAILHDIIEDCDISIAELTNLYNKNVSNMVEELSLPKSKKLEKSVWCKKKKEYISHISKASKETLTIVAVDKMVNMEAYFNYAITGQTKLLNELFGGTLQDYFWYYEKVFQVLELNIKSYPVTKDYKNTLQYYRSKLLTRQI